MKKSTTIPLLQQPVEVCLVLMPYASLERPSIALSILKASLSKQHISSSVIYGNLLFADKIGAHIYNVINKSQSHSLAGEWTFSNCAFPDFESDNAGYFNHTSYCLDCLQPFISNLGSQMDIRDVMQKIRTVTPDFIEEMAHQILAMQPRIVGCSSTFQQHCASLALLKRIKALAPDVITMMGGANCEASMGVITHKECDWVDYVVSGEADLIMPQLSKALLAGKPLPLEALPNGVIGPPHRNEEAYLRLSLRPPRAKLKNMADSPAPDFDDYFEFLKYVSCSKFIKPGLLMETSRGCWWGAISHCTFCGLNGESMAHRSKKQELVLAELQEMTEKYQMKAVEVVDNILDMAYFQFLIPKLGELDNDYELFYETKSNLNKDKLEKMSNAGIRWIQPGIESLDDTILKMIGKGTTARQNLQLMKWAQEKGIFVLWNLLYELPGESDDLYFKMAEWLPSISHLQPPSGFTFIQYNRFSPYQMRPKDYGIQLSPDKAYSYVYPWSAHSIENFAYYFDDYETPRVKLAFAEGEKSIRPGLDAVADVLKNWHHEWVSREGNYTGPKSQTHNLVYEEKENVIYIYDTRNCAVATTHRLEGIERAIFLICDQFKKVTAMQKRLLEEFEYDVDVSQIKSILTTLVNHKIILCLDAYYFSLPIKYPLHCPLPTKLDYPGGRLYSKLEARQMEFIKLAEQAFV